MAFSQTPVVVVSDLGRRSACPRLRWWMAFGQKCNVCLVQYLLV